MRHVTVILALGWPRQEDLKFNSTLGLTVSSRLACASSSNTKGVKDWIGHFFREGPTHTGKVFTIIHHWSNHYLKTTKRYHLLLARIAVVPNSEHQGHWTLLSGKQASVGYVATELLYEPPMLLLGPHSNETEMKTHLIDLVPGYLQQRGKNSSTAHSLWLDNKSWLIQIMNPVRMK